MDPRFRHRLLSAALIVLGGGAGRLEAQAPDSLPTGVTAAMIATGKKLFFGAGLCVACHGPEGKGLVGPDLTDGTWLHGSGSFADIVARVLVGVGSDSSVTGQIMPPRGGSGLSDDQIRAVAAYAWSLSRQGKKKDR